MYEVRYLIKTIHLLKTQLAGMKIRSEHEPNHNYQPVIEQIEREIQWREKRLYLLPKKD